MSHLLTALPLRAARWSASHPWRAILGWLALVALAVGLAAAIPTQETTSADYRVGESGRADALVEEAGLADPDAEHVLITTTGGGALDRAEAGAAGTALAERLGDVDGVAGVAPPQWSGPGTAALVTIALDEGHDDIEEVTAATEAVQRDHRDLELRQGGDVSLEKEINDRVADDLASAELTSVPVTLVLMLLAFGALVAAGLPVLLAGTSVAATIGVMAPISHLVPTEPTVGSMVVLIGMAVGVDYSLFYLKREREERAAGRGTRDAIEIAAETSGHSILVSGGAVIASLGALYVMGDPTFNSLATGAIVVVAVAVLGSITVLPALLATLGRWVDRPRVPLLWRLNARIGRGGISSRLLAPVLRHPLAALLASSLVVLALAVPALGMKTAHADLDTLPADLPAVATTKAIAAEFPTEGASARVVVSTAGDEASARRALERLGRTALAGGDFTGAGEVETSADGRTSTLELGMDWSETDPRAAQAVRTLRADLVPEALDGIEGERAVGGGVAEALDYDEDQRLALPLVIGTVLLLTMLMMYAAFRSVPIALLSTVLNLASVGVAFGVLALVFQHGWGSGALDVTTPGFVIHWIPLFVLVVLVGLSMDYHVFVVSRIREHVARGLPTRLAVERGIADTAGVVTSAAAVMVSVFSIFATLSMLEMKMMGVGLAAAILLDATLVRLVLLPAALVLLGERAWWPRRPRRPVGEQVVEQDPAYALQGR
ncbi:MMPL family transporter [Nocardioides sp. dk4132]|uniref:MMPL family transporter n=1 Tax=unclassified Nocardioides TaxID=2615069 RepID=UPI0012969FE0|nr:MULTISPECIES: MMPL family transporter [unclassified Nocardioides]MQW76570.1 MMPL family transporter [Nocardioides sp. dk4132]QGA07174.1 MMPL family transporter [Nocardioides sp. dk884]